MSLPSSVTSSDRRRADLHVHTIHSDGRHSMQQILDDAVQGLDLISICDHDTMGAYRSSWTLPDKLKLLPGIEMTCQVGDHDLHMLAYFPGGLTEKIHGWSRDLEEDRRERVLNGVQKLRESGLRLLWKDLEAEVGDSTPCRSHVARALVRSGLCSSPNQAFRQWLGRIPFRRTRLRVEDAFSQVHEMGGLNYWAHPQANHLDEYGDLLMKCGLDGIESLYKNLRAPHRRQAREFQEKFGLEKCGGSDLHQQTAKMPIGRFGIHFDLIDERLLNPAAPETWTIHRESTAF